MSIYFLSLPILPILGALLISTMIMTWSSASRAGMIIVTGLTLTLWSTGLLVSQIESGQDYTMTTMFAIGLLVNVTIAIVSVITTLYTILNRLGESLDKNKVIFS